MTPKKMRDAQALLAKRKTARQLIADTDKMSVYAVEVRLPARDGRIFVFSNDQPGAQRELLPALDARVCSAIVAALMDEADKMASELTAMGVDVAAADAEEAAEQGEA